MPEPAPAVRTAFRTMWGELAAIGRDETSGGYRRFAWTAVDHQLRQWFVTRCAALGLSVEVDRNGNQWAWWPADAPDDRSDERAAVVLGSHLDSVPDGGAFDGPLGVVSALAAVEELRRRGARPQRPIAVVNFADEEGARFGVACVGSRLLTGVLAPERARGLTDAEDVTLAEAMRAAGHDPHGIGRDDDLISRIGSYLELHIEQGRGLADLDAPLAVGSGIWPHGRWRIDLPGEANHAGTTRLEDRADAMLAAAAVVIAARRIAEERSCVATVGKLRVLPGAVNAVPSEVTAWLDARGREESTVRALVAEVAEIAAEFGGTLTEESWTPPTAFDPALVSRLGERLGGIPVLSTGAGHDAGILADAGIPSVMLFVRNRTGISHSPAEWAEEEDCLTGIAALADVLAELSGAR